MAMAEMHQRTNERGRSRWKYGTFFQAAKIVRLRHTDRGLPNRARPRGDQYASPHLKFILLRDSVFVSVNCPVPIYEQILPG